MYTIRREGTLWEHGDDGVEMLQRFSREQGIEWKCGIGCCHCRGRKRDETMEVIGEIFLVKKTISIL